jgi:hypothetical protein
VKKSISADVDDVPIGKETKKKSVSYTGDKKEWGDRGPPAGYERDWTTGDSVPYW